MAILHMNVCMRVDNNVCAFAMYPVTGLSMSIILFSVLYNT